MTTIVFLMNLSWVAPIFSLVSWCVASSWQLRVTLLVNTLGSSE